MDDEALNRKKEAEEVALMIRAATSSLPFREPKPSGVGGNEPNFQPVDHPKKKKRTEHLDPNATADGCNSDPPDPESFHVTFESLFRIIFGSCGSVVEVASFIVKSSWKPTNEGEEQQPSPFSMDPDRCGWMMEHSNNANHFHPSRRSRSRLLRREPPTLTIPLQNYYDDNVSAISAHTLEEMALQNVSFFGELSASLSVPPSPTRTCSTTSMSTVSRSDSRQQLVRGKRSILRFKTIRQGSITSMVSEASSGAEMGRVSFLPPRIPGRQLCEV